MKATLIAQFHPLHVIPTAPAQTIPIPLLRLVFPMQCDALIAQRRDHLARKLGAGPGGRVGIDDTYGHYGRRTEGGASGSEDLGGISMIRGMSKDDNMSQAARLKAMMQLDALESIEPDVDLEDGDGDLAFAGAFGAGPKKVDESITEETALDADTVDMAPIDWSTHVEGVQRVLGMEVRSPTKRSHVLAPELNCIALLLVFYSPFLPPRHAEDGALVLFLVRYQV